MTESNPARTAAVVALVITVFAGSARADIIAPSSWTRGDPYSSYHEWNFFSAPGGPNAPDVGNLFQPGTPGVSPNVVDTSGASFVTGSGNIYSPSAAVQIDATAPGFGLGNGYVTTIIAQTRTQGSELDYATVRLTYDDGSGDQTISHTYMGETARTALGGFGGSLVDRFYVFQVPDAPGQFLLEFDGAGSSVSFDRLAIDTLVTRADLSATLLSGMNNVVGFASTPVPEPATSVALLLAGLATFVAIRRSAGRPPDATTPSPSGRGY